MGKERRFNRSFQRMCSHHLVEPITCTSADGWGEAGQAAFQWKDAPPNGQVENQVKTSREDDFKPPNAHYAACR